MEQKVEIGRVHLQVNDLNRSVAFYERVLGFEVTLRAGSSSVFLSAGGGHDHVRLTAGDRDPGGRAATRHFALRYPDRQALGAVLRRITAAGVALDGALDHGDSDALYVRDPDGHVLELYYQRPREQWRHAADGSFDSAAQPLDVEALRAAGAESAPRDAPAPEHATALSDRTRARLGDMRLRLLNLHKVLLDDAKVAYEMDRGRVGSNVSLLQLVIHDPWFAWLHPLSELVVRIDETLRSDAPATEADGVALLDQVERLLSPGEGVEAFSEHYYEALQRQPAVVVAHAEVRRILKQAK